MKKWLYFLAGILGWVSASAQISLTDSKNSLEFSGVMGVLYNYRFYQNPSTNTDFSKNTFSLSTARIKMEGKKGRNWEYQFQFDLARLSNQDPGEFPAILDANCTYNGPITVTMGFQKLPYSRSSLVPFQFQPYWQRAEIARGYIFSRRDVGVTLEKSFWKQRAKIQAGVYSGQGEYILTAITGGDGDPSGKPEFVGRAEVSWPGRYRYSEVFDTRHVPYPMIAIGANGRYTQRSSSIKGVTDFDLKFVQGKKYVYGLDIAAQYMGLSALFEIHQLKMFPTGQDTNFLRARQTTYFRAGGYIAQLAYYAKRIKSGFLIRYDNLVPSDLIPNYLVSNVSFCYDYMVKGTKSMLRLQYIKRTGPENLAVPSKFLDDVVKVGWQFAF